MHVLIEVQSLRERAHRWLTIISRTEVITFRMALSCFEMSGYDPRALTIAMEYQIVDRHRLFGRKVYDFTMSLRQGKIRYQSLTR